jgi:AraC-like DNA-binding protein
MPDKIISRVPTHHILQNYVHSYVIWERESVLNNQKLFLPNNVCGIGFTLKGKLFVEYEDGIETTPITGIRNVFKKASNVTTTSNFLNVSVRFKPFGLAAFTNIDVQDIFQEKFIHLEVLFNKFLVEELYEKLLNCKLQEDIFNSLETFLLSQLNTEFSTKYFQFFEELELLNYDTLNVEKLSNKFETSERNLQRIFLKHIGITPKSYINLLRFRKLLSNVYKSNDTLLQQSLEVGYYDQSHFIKEFKHYTNLTPSQFQKLLDNNSVSDFYNTLKK